MNKTFTKPSEALAAIPPGTKFRVGKGGNGRPEQVPAPDGSLDWDTESFKTAVADGGLPSAKYIMRPVVAGKVSSRRINLELALSDENYQVIDPNGGQPEPNMAPQQFAAPFLQETVVHALVQTMREERDEVYNLREDIADLKEELEKLKIENAILQSKLESASAEDSAGQVMSKWGSEFLKNPNVGPILASKLLGFLGNAATQNSSPLLEAAKQAVVS